MIFITLGSQKFQFNRLLKIIDDLVKKGVITEEVVAQSGYSDYQPQSYKCKQFLDRNEFSEMIEKADIVITHGGTGAIIGAIKKGKKVIAVPRLAKYKEHVDDHQLQLIAQFNEQNLIYGLDDCANMEEALAYVSNHKFDAYKSNTEKYLEDIEFFICGGK
jgi:UDP-N-acetylglucosamine transferase subunit ALG13